MNRTNSCQSDSSGFLEEPLEPIVMQNSLLPENVSISSDSSDSQSTLLSGMETAYQECKQDVNGATDNITSEDPQNTLKLPLPNIQISDMRDRNTIKLSELSRNESLYFSLELPSESSSKECTSLGEEQKSTVSGEAQLKDDACNNLETSSHFYPPHADQLFYKVHAFHENDTLFDENNESECKEYIKNHLEAVKENSSGNGSLAESSLEEAVPLFCRPQETATGGTASVLSEPQYSERTSPRCPVTFSGLNENDTQNVRLKRGVQEIRTADLSAAQENDHSQTSKMTTNFYKSVTIQMSSDLMSSLQNSPSSDFLTKDYSYDIQKVGPANYEDEQVKPEVVVRTKKLNVMEVSSQTDEICARIFCPHHRHGTLTKSTSFDTGVFDNNQPLKNHVPRGGATKSCHVCHCCCCCYHYCCSLCGVPVPAGSACSMPCCSNYTSVELELLRTLKVLQDSLLNISPCTVREMETMKKSCQKFRDQLVETEQLIFEQQTFLPTDLTHEDREEMRRLQVLRRAVHREVAELECQLDDRTRQTREGILMQLNQLLEEQAKLHSELERIDWSEEATAQNPPTASSDLRSTPYPPTLATECALPVPQSTNIQASPVDSKETKTANPPKKGDFSTFLQNLKKTFKNSFGSENAE